MRSRILKQQASMATCQSSFNSKYGSKCYLQRHTSKIRSCRLRCATANSSRELTAQEVTVMHIIHSRHPTSADLNASNLYQQQQQQQHYLTDHHAFRPSTPPWISSSSEHISISSRTAANARKYHSHSLHYPQQQQQHYETPTAAAAAVTRIPAPSDALSATLSALQDHPEWLQIHLPFAAFFSYLAVMAAAASSSDWYLDICCFGAVWAGLWAVCARWHPSPRTVVLLNLLPLLHLTGALGTYHWELGNLSWDILVHISNGFIGTLLFAAIIGDLTNAQQQQQQQQGSVRIGSSSSTQGAFRSNAWRFLQVSSLLIIGTTLIEVVENLGGQLAGTGEGIFLRGAGDFCTAALPCSEDVDTAKDMVDNVAGMMMAMVALGVNGLSKGSSSGGGGSTAATAAAAAAAAAAAGGDIHRVDSCDDDDELIS